jgi:PAS domain S-box-containing protein
VLSENARSVEPVPQIPTPKTTLPAGLSDGDPVPSVVVRLPSLAVFEDPLSILEALPDGVLVSDAASVITYANVRMEQLTGYEQAELLGLSVDLLVPERLRRTHERDRVRFSAHPNHRPMGGGLDTRLLRKDGTDIPVQIQLTVTRIDGKPGVMALVRDLGEATGAERLVRQHEDVLMLVADREVIAMEANAGVMHTLFGIGLHLQAAAANTTDPRASRAMEMAIADIDLAIAEVREHIFRHIDMPI